MAGEASELIHQVLMSVAKWAGSTSPAPSETLGTPRVHVDINLDNAAFKKPDRKHPKNEEQSILLTGLQFIPQTNGSMDFDHVGA